MNKYEIISKKRVKRSKDVITRLPAKFRNYQSYFGLKNQYSCAILNCGLFLTGKNLRLTSFVKKHKF